MYLWFPVWISIRNLISSPSPTTHVKMDSTRNGFDDFFDYNLYESEHGPQQLNANLVQHQPVLDQAVVVWNELKLQISNFNKIIVVPDATFEAWSEADQTQVADFMA